MSRPIYINVPNEKIQAMPPTEDLPAVCLSPVHKTPNISETVDHIYII